MLRPLFQLFMAGKERFRIVCYLQEPLLHFLLLDKRFTPPALLADDLFIRQDSLALRTPVDLAFSAVSQIPVEHLQKNPLVPLVILRQTGVDLS